MRAGELVSRPALARSTGHRSLAFSERRRDRGVLLFAYFLLDKQEKVRRPRFGNRNYNLLIRLIRAERAKRLDESRLPPRCKRYPSPPPLSLKGRGETQQTQ